MILDFDPCTTKMDELYQCVFPDFNGPVKSYRVFLLKRDVYWSILGCWSIITCSMLFKGTGEKMFFVLFLYLFKCELILTLKKMVNAYKIREILTMQSVFLNVSSNYIDYLKTECIWIKQLGTIKSKTKKGGREANRNIYSIIGL